MKKVITMLLVGCLAVLCLVGCGETHTSKSLTFTIETGDKIKITVDTTGGYDFTGNSEFSISKDGETLVQGVFVYVETAHEYYDAVYEDALATVIKEGDNYIFYNYNDEEYNYIYIVSGTNTGMLIGSVVSEEVAEECFGRMSFELVD